MPRRVSSTSWLRRGRVLRLRGGDLVWSILPPLEAQARWRLQTHAVAQGERLDRLADRYLGDPDLWWVLAELNGCRSPWDIEDGQLLQVPDRRTVQLEVLVDA